MAQHDLSEGSADSSPVTCPACGGENAHDAVFCANQKCHKALGDFKFIKEELQLSRRWHESLAERVTRFIAKPQFLLFHGIWFTAWVLINTGLLAMWVIRPFDGFPFSLLGIILSAEAIFITGFVLISQNLQNQEASIRAELDYEVNVRTYRHIADVSSKLEELMARLDRIESSNNGSKGI